MTTTTISDDDRRTYLDELRAQNTLNYIPAMVFLLTLAVVGVFGNSLMLLVYSRKFNRTPTRVFILAMATFDIIANVIVIPAEVYIDMFHAWDFNNPRLCQCRLYFNAFTSIGSGLLLCALAITRYRKICTPFGWQVSVKHANITCASIVVTTMVFSVPFAIINGRQTVETGHEGVKGYKCSIDDSYKYTIWPTVTGAFFTLIFLATSIPLVVLYILIGVQAWKHSKIYGAGGAPGAASGVGKPSSSTRGSNQLSINEVQNIDSGINLNSGDFLRADEKGRERENRDSAKAFEDVEVEYPDDTDSVRIVRAPTGNSLDNAQLNLCIVNGTTTNTMRTSSDKKEKRKRHSTEARFEDNSDSDCEVEMEGTSKESEPTGVSGVVEEDTKDSLKRSCWGVGNMTEEHQRVNSSGEMTIGMDAKNGLKSERKELSRDLNESWFDDENKGEEFGEEGEDSGVSFNKAVSFATESVSYDVNSGNGAGYVCKSTVAGVSETEEETGRSRSAPMIDDEVSEQCVNITYCLNEETHLHSGSHNNTGFLSRKDPSPCRCTRKSSFLLKQNPLSDKLTDTSRRVRKSRQKKEAGADTNRIHTEDDANTASRNSGTGNDEAEKMDSGKASDVSIGESNQEKTDIGKTSVHNKTGLRKLSRVSQCSKGTDDGKRQTQSSRRRGVGRTTLMLIVISAVYILGFLPMLAMLLLRSLSPKTVESMTPAELSAHYLFLRFYFLNCAANPIVYSLSDKNFRKECKTLFRKCTMCRSKRPVVKYTVRGKWAE